MDKAWMIIIIIYLVAANIVGFVLMGADKSKARRGAWRIPEKTFFIVSLLGGSLGTFLGMMIFRHKTRHWYFILGIPLIMILQAGIAIWLQTR